MEEFVNEDGTVKIKRVVFHNGVPDFIVSLEYWLSSGGYQGFIKDNCISIFDIKEVQGGYMDPEELENLPEWEG